jgi:general secretion pathway protein G
MNRPPLRSRSRSGFTFLEIMMVVVIIGILLAIVGPRLAGRTQKARVTAAKTQLGNIATALKNFEIDMGSFPEQSEGLKALREKPRSDDADAWDGPYLEKEIPLDPWGQPYQYKYPGEKNPKDFDLWSNGPDKKSGTDDDITNWVKTEK